MGRRAATSAYVCRAATAVSPADPCWMEMPEGVVVGSELVDPHESTVSVDEVFPGYGARAAHRHAETPSSDPG